jgi:hypothetical protein
MSDVKPTGLLTLPSIYDRAEEPGKVLMRHVREQLAAADLPRLGSELDPGAETTGLIPKGAFGDTGFSVQELSERELEFHIVISGENAGIEYNEWSEWQGGHGTMKCRQPTNQRSLHVKIRDTFREMGFDVKKVKNDSYEKYDNDDVSYVVITDYPEILKISRDERGNTTTKKEEFNKEWDKFFNTPIR